MAQQCAMIVGYLVPHRCPNKALATCIKCGRMFCDEHVAIVQEGLICLACQQGIEQPVLIPQLEQDFTAEDMTIFTALDDWDSSGDTFADLS